VNEIIKLLRINPKGRSSHAFRHTLIVMMLRRLKQDPAIIAELAGNSVRTIYDHYDKMSPLMRPGELRGILIE